MSDIAIASGGLRIAFAGHRNLTHQADLGAALGDALALGPAALGLKADIWLQVGCAPGGDQMALEAWRRRFEGGRVHALLPFRHPDAGLADAGATADPDLLDSGGEAHGRYVFGLNQAFDAWTVLDGAASEAEIPPRNAHLEQARWLVRWSDLAVAVWDGEAPRGPGGAADTVSLALARGIPVVWVCSAPPYRVRLIDPEALWPDMSLLELVEALGQLGADPPFLRSATVETLGPLLRASMAAPWETAEPRPLADLHTSEGLADEAINYRHYLKTEAAFKVDPGLGREIGPVGVIRNAYANFKRRHGGPFRSAGETLDEPAPSPPEPGPPQPDDQNIAATKSLAEAYAQADAISNLTSAQHRSEQLWLLRLAVLAVMVGVAPVAEVLFSDHHSIALKAACVAAEGGILGLMYLLWASARKARRHHLWNDARRYAERLRAVRACWPLGIDVKDGRADPPGAWTEWRTQALLRTLGPPRGVMSKAGLLQAARQARRDIVEGQASYHEANAHLMHRVHVRLERLENRLFVTLTLALLVFFCISVGLLLLHRHEPDDWWIKAGALLLLASAVFPAIGAAGIALEAKLEFGTVAARSARLAPRFKRLNAQLGHALGEGGGPPSATAAAEVVRDAARLLVNDVDVWRDELERRRIIRGP